MSSQAHRVCGCTEVPTATCGISSRDQIDYGDTDGLITHAEICAKDRNLDALADLTK